MRSEMSLPAPGKLNLFLHILGRRADGYHQLQSVFQLLDYCDQLDLAVAKTLSVDCSNLPQLNDHNNLVVKAAQLLQQATGYKQGAHITLHKHLPLGGGLGGGSSDAATTLIGLNYLWQTQLSITALAQLGLQLGADVPVFIHGHSAWAEGVGEQLTAIELPEAWYIVLTPACQVSTAQVFQQEELTRNSSPITIAAFLKGGTRNDCEAVVRKLYPAVDHALTWLNQFAAAKLTGTGACVFAQFASATEADQVLKQVPPPLTGFVTRGLNKSPLHQQVKLRYTTCS